jgi:putative hydrolase of the HAD superfamily
MITQLIFDLDNTLYPARYGLEDRVHDRLFAYIAGFLNMPLEAAREERRKYIDRYGSTLEWLLVCKGFTDVEDYFRAVHPEDEADGLPFDPELGPFLEGLHLPLAILTNSPREHADRILEKLQIRHLFPRIFDIRFHRFRGKPHPEAFLHTLEVLGKRPEETIFVDDYVNYVQSFNALGGQGVLIDEFDRFPTFPGRRIRSIKEIGTILDDHTTDA